MTLNDFSLSPQDVLYQIKLSGQIHSIVESVVSEKIIAQVATEMAIEIESEEIQQEADKIRLANQLYKPEQTWIWLERQGLVLDDLEYIARKTLVAKKLAQKLFSDQIKQFFIANQLNYHSAIIYEIVFDDPDLAMEIFYAISESEIEFARAAREYCQDQQMRRSGGYRGNFNRQQLKPEFASAIFAASPPQLLKPIVTSHGAHLIMVEEILQPTLDDGLENKILSDLFTMWLKQKLMEVDTIQMVKNL
jgi:hypothetical protein